MMVRLVSELEHDVPASETERDLRADAHCI